MARHGRKIVQGAAGLLFAVLMAGCATANQKTTVPYQPVVNATGGAGELYLAVACGEPAVTSGSRKSPMNINVTRERPVVRRRFGNPPVRNDIYEKWVVVTVRDDKGKKLGTRVSPLASDDLLRDALRQELHAAGYTVKLVNRLPKDVGKGIELSGVFVDQEQVSGLLTDDGTCWLQLSIGLWRNGARLKKIDYASSFSDFALVDRDRLTADLMTNVIQAAMKQSIPDIITALEN